MSRVLALAVAFLVASPAWAAGSDGPPEHPWFGHVNFGVNLYTYVAGERGAPGKHYSPKDRLNFGQQVGVGYFIRPNLRAQLTVQFGENATGLAPGTSPMAFVGVIGWLIYSARNAFFGAGLLVAPRAFAKNDLQSGIFLSGGYVFRLPHRVGLSLAVQVPITIFDRFSAQITPLVSVSHRF